MKKLLLIGFVLAICLLAFPQGVLADKAESPVVDANIEHALVFTAPSPAEWTLTRGSVATDNYLSDTGSADPIFITVSTAQNWELTAEDVSVLGTKGKMVPTAGWKPDAAGPLTNALYIETHDPAVPGATGTYSDLTAVRTIRSGKSPGYYTWNEDLKQTVALGDYALTTGKYEITIKFFLNEL